MRSRHEDRASTACAIADLPSTAPVAWSSLGRCDGEHTDLLRELAIDDHERVPLHHVSPNASSFGIRCPRLGKASDQPERCTHRSREPIPYFAPSARSSSRASSTSWTGCLHQFASVVLRNLDHDWTTLVLVAVVVPRASAADRLGLRASRVGVHSARQRDDLRRAPRRRPA